ncbi:MAG: transposase [Nannocystaceae bacterium]|nr:transposase [Nannocystaceae bacterium]
MSRTGPDAVEQLELLGLDRSVLHAAGIADPEQLLARWRGPRVPCEGLLRLRCGGCKLEAAVRFRCDGSCGDRCEHDARAAASLVRAIPRVPVRHWVLSLPGVLQAASAADQRWVARLCRELLAGVFALLRRKLAQQPGGAEAIECGGASVVHRVARGLALDVHVHALVLDGGYLASGRASPLFVPLSDEPTAAELLALTRGVRERLLQQWRGREQDRRALAELTIASALAPGPTVHTAARRLRIDSVDAPPRRQRITGVGARREGFGVHAMPRIDAEARVALVRLAEYLVRAPVSLQSLRPGPRGIVQRLPHAFADGTTHVEFAPEELARRLQALTPPRAVHRICYHGVLAPTAAVKWRRKPLQLALVGAPDAGERPRPRRSRGDGALRCRSCGGRMRVVALEEAADPAPFGALAGRGAAAVAARAGP